MNSFSRRKFLQISSGAALGAGLGAGCATGGVKMAAGPKAAPVAVKKFSANDKIVVGLIGCGGRGNSDLQWFRKQPDVEVAAVADLYPPHRDMAIEQTNGKAKGFQDFRKLLELKEIDAVLVCTPPHWHPLISIYAMQAGKDVYCEKPMCMSPLEGRAMIKVARANKRITQVGTQLHASENYHRVVEIVRSGVLGKISRVHVMVSLNEAPDGIGNPPNTDPPKDLDWDMWCGPIEKVPYNLARFQKGQHRYFKETIGSWLHELGPHIMDMATWAMQPGHPKSVMAMGGKFATKDISTIPDTMDAMFEYDGFMMTWSNMCANSFGHSFQKKPGITRRLGVSFHGVNGTLTADYDSFEITSEGDRMKDVKLPDPSLPRVKEHAREFLDCMRSRELPSCDVENHFPLHVALNLGNIAYKVGRKIHWDAKTEQIVGDKEANALANPVYRKPWVLPV